MPRNTSKKAGKILPALFRLLGTLLIIAVIVLLLPFVLPRFLGLDTYRIVSGSMEPRIPVGSMVLVEPVLGKDMTEGEVMAFYRNGTIVVHRVLENNTLEGMISTKGDANDTEDLQEVSYPEVIGRVKASYPYMGDIAAYLTTVYGKVYLLAVIACGAMCYILAGRLEDPE